MGHVYVIYGDRAECLNDLDLWAIRQFLMDAAVSLATEESDGGLDSLRNSRG